LLLLLQTAVLDAVLEGLREVEPVSSEEGHAVPFGDNNLVEARPVGSRNVKVIGFGIVLSVVIVEERNAELQQVKIDSSLFDSLIKFPMVGKKPLDVVELGH
jgi:undecaprenyl pyrophosphate phosphatase UppP